MLVTLFGIINEVKPVHPINAPLPIRVILFGIIIEDKPLQPLKAASAMAVTLFGIIEFIHPAISVLFDFLMIALQLLRESK